MATFILCLELLGICMIFTAMVLLLAGEGSREQKLMCYILCGALLQNVGYMLEFTAPSLEAALTAIKLEYLGSTFLPLCYCWFMYNYCYEKPPKKLLRALAVIDFVTLPFVLFLDKHPWFYKSYTWVESYYGTHFVDLDYGFLYPITTITRIVLPYMLSLYAIYRAQSSSSDEVEKRRYLDFLLISILPVTALLSYALKLTNIFDLTPVTLGLSMSLVVILVWSRRNYDFRRVAADAVLDSMGDGVVVLDEQERLVSYNRAAQDIFPQLKGRRVGDRLVEPKGFWEGLMDEGVAQTLELEGRFYESHAKQITGEDGKHQGCVILVLDITDTRNYIDEIMRVRLQAEQANVAKSEFLANMSHEIRTPMNAITGLSDLIMEESQGRKVYTYAKDVQSAARNLLAIINDILDLSKVEAGKMELVMSEYHIRGLVGEIVSMMEIAASQRGLLMKSEYEESIPCRYEGDEGRIKQILINLLNNAVKFTKEGYVKISVQGMAGEGEDEELLVISVEDTGCGIREEDRQKIFEDFRQVDAKRNRSVEGTGLGLSITRHLVQLMGGSIELSSEYGVGSTFTVTIPQKIVDPRPLSEVPEPPAQKAATVKRFKAPSYKALIVDDNKVNRKVAAGFLKPYCFQLSEAESGPEAIKLVEQNRYDMIFMDHMMPEMDGIEATEIIRRDCGENGRAPVIVALTANAMEGVRDRFLTHGFDDYIPKPLERKAFGELLDRWVPEDRREGGADGDEEEIDPSLIQIEGINPATVVKYHSGSLADYRALLDLYCMDGKRKQEVLREYAFQEDCENYEIEVHALKSASANIGAVELSAMAKAHEDAAVRKDEGYIQAKLPELLGTYEKLLAAIRAFLGDGGDSGAQEDLPPMEAEELKDKAAEALGWLEHFRSHECLEIVEDALRHALPEGAAPKLREIQDQLKMYEDDAAEELLRQFLQWLDKEE